MTIVKEGFNYVAADQQTGLFIRAAIYDITDSTPTFVEFVPLFELDSVVSPGSYSGIFDATVGLNYSVTSFVYLDSGFTTLDPNRAPGCVNINAGDSGSSSGGLSSCDLVGYIQNNNALIGIIDTVQLVGIIEC